MPIVESQRPQLLPLEPEQEIHAPSDRPSLAYRQCLRKVGWDERFYHDEPEPDGRVLRGGKGPRAPKPGRLALRHFYQDDCRG
jgi:hypothetical protein